MNKILIDLPETLETKRLFLRMPQAGWGKKLHDAMCDGYGDYVRWINWDASPPSLEKVEEECRRHHADFILKEFIRYILVSKETGDVVGRCAFPPFQANWTIPQFGISYFVRKRERGKGYATEAAHAMTLLAFRTLNARKVEIYCDAENTASTAVPQKLGFSHEYTQRGGWPRPDGKLAELMTFSLFSEKDLRDGSSA